MKIIFLRHASYSSFPEKLTENGKSEIMAKIPVIKQLVGESKNIKLFAGSALRTVESMQLIADELQMSFTIEEGLSDNSWSWKWCLETIESAKAEDTTTVIICLVHVQTISSISSRHVDNLGITPKNILCMNAEGIVLDLDKKEMKKI